MRYFVIRGFGAKKDSSGREIDFDRVDRELIAEAMQRCGHVGGTTGQVADAGNIRSDMFALILEADIVVCDITVHNANVFYELGVRHALRKKHTILIKGDPSADTTPFDLTTDRYTKYPLDDPAAALDDLVAAVQAGVNGSRPTDSPIFLLLQDLPELDRERISVAPLDFIEEVQRAEACGDKGWLRLLADDLRGQRFESPGLRAVARAQWSLKDIDGARASWEAVRADAAQDLEANFALANLYERLFRSTQRADQLELSNQAIRTVLDREDLDPRHRAEGLALQGRNFKTLWRLGWEALPSVAERRARALENRLRQSYEAYSAAFAADLNSCFPGIASLQMGFVLQTLSDSPLWRNLFGRDAVQAQRYREDLQRQMAALVHVVAASIAHTRQHGAPDDRMWADISDADLLFLTEPEDSLSADPGMAVAAYQGAIPDGKAFAWDAARGQLSLFSALGIRAPVADAVIAALDQPRQVAPTRHLLVFTGHTLDGAQSPAPRFPAAAQAKARQLIADRIAAHRRDSEDLVVLASAAPGADILLHEVCTEQGVRSLLCLPMPAEDVARLVFGDLDDWRNRLFDVVEARRKQTFILQKDAELPRWLRGSNTDPWERGNRWVQKMAEAWGADRVTLLALWDGNDSGNGGVAQMVRLARDSGLMRLDRIDSRQLLA